ncbi:MBL fold metallo-hydrolase [Psychroflexus montanilacus]|uniref:MBL fold metallo-hydrolase n=1 Tax=Psychroflexus montanilacus TaxID=2873598 RepID=UPI001CCC1292|nr:MBL fold metallo-hydrolase [Psychroflexus montanilacus]MBZ9651837.1 MBL fold metallo-hydrolase [Psychroflexus montanilacus]
MNSIITKNKRLWIILSIYLLACLGLVVFLRNPPDAVINYLFQTAITQNKSRNFFEKDGLYVITTGTGAPMPDKNRTGSQTVVVAGEQVLVFDAGPGSTLKLELSPVDVGTVDALFITHFHSDHIGGIGELMLKRWATGSPQQPLPIYGPSGIDEVVNGFEAAYQLDKGYRIAHHGEKVVPSSGFGGEAHSFDLGSDLMSSKTVYKQGEVEVIAFNVEHAPVFPAVGYRVNYKGRSIVITGDTKYTESLIHHSNKADVLIIEALNKKFATMMANAGENLETNVTAIATDIQDYHISPKEAADVAREAGVKQLVITHILPPVPSDLMIRPFLKEARAVYDGKIYMVNDGTLISLPINSDEIKIQELLK